MEYSNCWKFGLQVLPCYFKSFLNEESNKLVKANTYILKYLDLGN